MQSFFALIDRLNSVAPAERPGIEELVRTTFGVEKAVLTLDMSHLSLSVPRTGIVPFLGVIRRMHVLTEPIVRRCGGEVIKYAADNLLSLFPGAGDAVAAAVGINQALYREPVPAGTEACRVGIGIDFGSLLRIPGHDCYGDPVNIAYKLGEDVARPGEILISAAARGRLPAEFPHGLREHQVSVSGLEFLAYSVQFAPR